MSNTNMRSLDDIYNDFTSLVGDTPVSEQLSIALNRVAEKSHVHGEYVTREEYDKLKSQLETLIDLVGDESVSEQISNAINNIK